MEIIIGKSAHVKRDRQTPPTSLQRSHLHVWKPAWNGEFADQMRYAWPAETLLGGERTSTCRCGRLQQSPPSAITATRNYCHLAGVTDSPARWLTAPGAEGSASLGQCLSSMSKPSSALNKVSQQLQLSWRRREQDQREALALNNKLSHREWLSFI